MTDEIELPNQEKSEHSEKGKLTETWEYWKRTPLNNGDGKKFKENEKHIRNKSTLQKSHQRDKHLVCPPCKILGTILKLDNRRTSANEPENKKTYNYR